MRHPYHPRIGQGMFDWIRSSRPAPMRETYEPPRGESYYEAPVWPSSPSRYPIREARPEFRSAPPREEPGMFNWVGPSRPAMSGPGNSSYGWLVGLSVAVGFGIAAALAYFSPAQQEPPRA
jgi:hypothetical protein